MYNLDIMFIQQADPFLQSLFRELGISNDDIRPLNKENTYYNLPLTHAMHAALLARTD